MSRPVSGAWRFFHIKDGDERIAVCAVCSMEVPRGKVDASKSSYSVHPLWSHLRVYHRDEHIEAEKVKSDIAEKKEKDRIENEKKKQIYSLQATTSTVNQTLTEMLEKKKMWPSNSSEHRLNTKRLIYWLIDSMQSYNTVQNEMFKKFIQGEI